MASASDGDDSFRLDGKVALITGSSAGIGRSIAVRFSELGARLSLVGRNAQQLEITAQQCLDVQDSDDACKPLLVQADLSKEADTERVVKETIEKFDRLDILVNCAGVYATGTIETTSLKQLDDVFNINLRAVYHLTMLCVPHLIQTQGNVVNVSSLNALRVFPGDLAYCMSKAALDQMTRCVALELGPKQVRVNSVNPGVILTDIHRKAGMDEEAYQKFLVRCRDTHPLGRAGDAEEVGRTVAFLASPAASYVTGATLPVDGGRQATCPT